MLISIYNKRRAASLCAVAILCLYETGCNGDSNNWSSQYEGPTDEKRNPLSVLNSDYKCPINKDAEDFDATKLCLQNNHEMNTAGCGYSTIYLSCRDAWKNHPDIVKDKFVKPTNPCELVFPTLTSVYYFTGTDVKDLNTGLVCSEEIGSGNIIYSDRNVLVEDINVDDKYNAFPYRGRYDDTKRTIKIRVINHSRFALSDDGFKNKFSSMISEMIKNFGGEVWGYKAGNSGQNKILTSFPVAGEPDISYSGKLNTATINTSRFVVPCDAGATFDKCYQANKTNQGHTYLEGVSSPWTYGVTSDGIYVNLIVLDAQSIMQYYGGGAANAPFGSVAGEIESEATPPNSRTPEGMTVFLYARGEQPNVLVAAHEVGHALLTYHYTSLIGVGGNVESHIMNPIKSKIVVPVNIKPYKSQALTISGIRYGQAYIHVKYLSLWPTSEGVNSTLDGLQKNSEVTK